MTSWLIGQAGLTALRAADEALAARYFNTASGYVIGSPPAGWATTGVSAYTSFAAYASARLASRRWVLYDPESWPQTPLVEQQHPAAFLSAFTTLATARGNPVIAAPARDLMGVPAGDYTTATRREPVDAAFLSAGLPGACAPAAVYHCQAQALQADPPAAYMALLAAAAAQLPEGHTVWAGLSTQRGVPVAAITASYQAALGVASGFWLNTDAATAGDAAAFLGSIT